MRYYLKSASNIFFININKYFKLALATFKIISLRGGL